MAIKLIQILKKIFFWACIFIWGYFISCEYIDSLEKQIKHPISSDFYKFYLSGKLYNNDESMYWIRKHDEDTDDNSKNIIEPEPGTDTLTPPPYLHPNLNPPTFTLLISPIAKLNFNIALTIWSILSLLSGLISTLLIYKTSTNKKSTVLSSAFIVLAYFSFFPIFANFRYGQVGLFLLLILTLAWLAQRQEKSILSGVLISLAISIKPFIGLFILSFLFFRMWKVFFSCIGSLAIILLSSLAIVGIGEYETYFRVLKTVDWLSTNWNASIPGFFARILGGTSYPSMFDYPWAAKLASLFFSFIVVICIYVAGHRLRAMDCKEKSDMLFSITIPAMLLTSPLGWLYYFPILLICGVQIIKFQNTFRNRRAFWLTMAIPTLIISTPSALLACRNVDHPKAWIVDASANFYSLLIIFTTVLLSLRTFNKSASTVTSNVNT